MRLDPEYEEEEMETNMESMFEHVNQMINTDMPRDYLASMSRHFIRENGGLSSPRAQTTTLEKEEGKVFKSVFVHVLSLGKRYRRQ